MSKKIYVYISKYLERDISTNKEDLKKMIIHNYDNDERIYEAAKAFVEMIDIKEEIKAGAGDE